MFDEVLYLRVFHRLPIMFVVADSLDYIFKVGHVLVDHTSERTHMRWIFIIKRIFNLHMHWHDLLCSLSVVFKVLHELVCKLRVGRDKSCTPTRGRRKHAEIPVSTVVHALLDLAVRQKMSKATLGLLVGGQLQGAIHLLVIDDALLASVEVLTLLAHLLFQLHELCKHVWRWARCHLSAFSNSAHGCRLKHRRSGHAHAATQYTLVTIFFCQTLHVCVRLRSTGHAGVHHGCHWRSVGLQRQRAQMLRVSLRWV